MLRHRKPLPQRCVPRPGGAHRECGVPTRHSTRRFLSTPAPEEDSRRAHLPLGSLRQQMTNQRAQDQWVRTGQEVPSRYKRPNQAEVQGECTLLSKCAHRCLTSKRSGAAKRYSLQRLVSSMVTIVPGRITKQHKIIGPILFHYRIQ